MNSIAMNRNDRMDGRPAGFTLLELLVVVAIIAILAAIALPSYTSYVTKTNRAAAEACLSEYSNYMERYYTTYLSYYSAPASGSTAGAVNPAVGTPTKLSLDCATTAQTGNNYQYDVVAPATTASYILTAAPQNTQLKRDTQCGSLTLDQAGNRTSSGTDTTTKCWGG